MNKRVHEIAKERGLPAKQVLEALRSAGVNVKAASSSVDEAVAQRVLGNGDSSAAAPTLAPQRQKDDRASPASKPETRQPRPRPDRPPAVRVRRHRNHRSLLPKPHPQLNASSAPRPAGTASPRTSAPRATRYRASAHQERRVDAAAW